ncbi:Ribosomal protein L17 [Trinorchestia longiramus]|nr:Ribosomal protein L17 [Trinorchestia longiramus]
MIPALRIAVRPKALKLGNREGVKGKLDRLSKLVTTLVRDERVEHTFSTLSEARDYAERLIAEAIHHGDCHQPTMELADFWLKEKQLVHKLFKVLVPRYRDTTISYTKMYKAPMPYPASGYEGSTLLQRKDYGQAILELRNNPLLPVLPRPTPTRNWIHNVLLEEARKEYRLQKSVEAELAMQHMEAHEETNPDEEID